MVMVGHLRTIRYELELIERKFQLFFKQNEACQHLAEILGIEVRQINFISYLENLDEDIGILKIDIEGAEVELLEALFDRPDILKRVHHIFAETHERRILGHESRVNALHERAHRIIKPHINLYWH